VETRPANAGKFPREQMSKRTTLDSTPDGDALDLLWGATAIAQALNTTTRRAFWMLENEAIPAKKVRGRWVASRSALRRFFDVEAT
jgi:hypothetical protein